MHNVEKLARGDPGVEMYQGKKTLKLGANYQNNSRDGMGRL